MNSQLMLFGYIFKAFVLCMIVVMWIATREMMKLVSEERTMARIGLWIMRILVMLMIAPFLLIGNVDGTPILYASAAAMMALGILAVIMRLFVLKDPVQTTYHSDQDLI